jgi:VanZ family protein
MVLIFILSSIPGKELPVLPFPGFDKIVHIIEYSVLGFLLSGIGKNTVFIFLVGLLYGLSDEIHQIFVPFREFSLLDILSDAVGVYLGILCHLLLKKYRSAC